MIRQYLKIFRELKKMNKKTMKYAENSFCDYIFRQIGTLISPAFIILRLHPTSINFINLFLGVIAFLVVYFNEEFLNYSILVFYLSVLVDNTDGNVARYTKVASFYGRFMDGIFDILVAGFLRLSIFYFILRNYNYDILIILSLLSILFIPITHLYYDRYSAIVRWSNHLNKTKLKPYIRNKYGKNINFLLIDIQHFILFFILIFYQSKSLLENLILIFLIFSILHFIFNTLLHFKYSYKFLKNSPNLKRNI
jgi:phosphatidylglycerophosphate synthase